MNAIRGWLYGKPEGGSPLASGAAPSGNSTPTTTTGSLPPAPQIPQPQQEQQSRMPVNIPLPPQQSDVFPGGYPAEWQQPPQAKPIEHQTIHGQELHQAADRVNETKALYDSCEARRMTAVINGKDAQDYSCEREFAAFKKAFDIQLALESKMPPVGSQGH